MILWLAPDHLNSKLDAISFPIKPTLKDALKYRNENEVPSILNT